MPGGLAMKHIMHEFELEFYMMWTFTNALLAGLFYVAVQHL